MLLLGLIRVRVQTLLLLQVLIRDRHSLLLIVGRVSQPPLLELLLLLMMRIRVVLWLLLVLVLVRMVLCLLQIVVGLLLRIEAWVALLVWLIVLHRRVLVLIGGVILLVLIGIQLLGVLRLMTSGPRSDWYWYWSVWSLWSRSWQSIPRLSTLVILRRQRHPVRIFAQKFGTCGFTKQDQD